MYRDGVHYKYLYIYFSGLTTHEMLAHLKELDNVGDVYMGLPEIDELSDGDSDQSDEEARANSLRLKRGILAAPAEIADASESDNEVPESLSDTENSENPRKRAVQRRWLKKSIDEIHSVECNSKVYSQEVQMAETPVDIFKTIL